MGSSGKRLSAMILLGPTGVGKTPLGNYFQTYGIPPCHTCIHLDFGELIRQAICDGSQVGLSEAETDFLRELVQQGALLENETFFLAQKIIHHFLLLHPLQKTSTLYILNGIPRHINQALGLEPIFRIQTIIFLHASPSIIKARIQRNPAGDRSNRTDDSEELIERKLKIFQDRTYPLIQHYQRLHVPLIEYQVNVQTLPQEIYQAILPSLQNILSPSTESTT